MKTMGHLLWSLLQDGTENGKPFDYWPELPERRRQQYEDAAQALIKLGDSPMFQEKK